MCDEYFATIGGLGVHKRKAHARAVHSAGAAEINASQKRRWTSEDMRVMATLEVEILGKNPKAFVNQELCKVIENRTLDSISGKRRSLAYRDLRDELKNSPVSQEMDTLCEYRSEVSNSSSEERDTIPEPGMGWDEDLRKFILSSSVQADLDPRLVSWLREWDLKCSPSTDIRDIIEQDLDSIFPKEGVGGNSAARVNRNRTKRVKDNVSVKVTVERNRVKLSMEKSRRRKRSSNRVNRTGLRKQQYAIIQELYKKNRKSCFRKVVSGSWKMVQEGSALSSLDEQTSFWAPLLEGVSNGRIEVGGDECDPLYEMVKPITEDELERTLRRLYNGAPGPDRIKKSGIQSLSKERLSTRFNFYMLVGI